MEESIKLAENVILVDVAYFNNVINDLKKYFEAQLRRSLQDIYVEEWASYLALDAGVRDKDNKIEVLFVHDAQVDKIVHCNPADLKKELNGVGYTNPLGELTFTSVSSEALVSRENLYLDLLSIILNSADVKRLMLVPCCKDYGAKLEEVLNEATVDAKPEKAKDIFLFSMNEAECPRSCKWDSLGYSLIRALGVKAEELQ
ncbi:DUF6621 family protein [Bacteroides sp. UBA939]|uniref:DUF6621 family protein n=1 Tax=Bacteroides sp. UBA939 TaxID=1946092 RepID=UPI0025BDF0F7|nr:DUF6621 family protein [Bacteroides sp. UBA939]